MTDEANSQPGNPATRTLLVIIAVTLTLALILLSIFLGFIFPKI